MFLRASKRSSRDGSRRLGLHATLVLALALGGACITKTAAQAEPGEAVDDAPDAAFTPRFVHCSVHGAPINAELHWSDDDSYEGTAHDNYELASYSACPIPTTRDLICDATWTHTKASALVKISLRPDGLIKGELKRPGGEVVTMSCSSKPRRPPGHGN